MKQIGTELKDNPLFLKREDIHKNLLRKVDAVRDSVNLGGGKSAIKKHHDRGKLTARERIEKLIDENSKFFELSTFAAHEMYLEYGGAPGAGNLPRFR